MEYNEEIKCFKRTYPGSDGKCKIVKVFRSTSIPSGGMRSFDWQEVDSTEEEFAKWRGDKDKIFEEIDRFAAKKMEEYEHQTGQGI